MHIDKSKNRCDFDFANFCEKKYHLFSGFTVEKQDVIKSKLEKHIEIGKN